MTTNNLRIILSSNAPWGYSGYSNQSRLIMTSLYDAGYKNLAMSCFYGLEGGIIEWNGIKCYPKIGRAYGEDAMLEHGRDFKADVTMTLQDIWTLDMNILNQIPNWVPWVPIDFSPLPKHIMERLRFANRIIAMSEFGQKEMAQKGYASHLIPHGVDTTLFKKLKSKKEAKKKLGIPEDIFLFGMVSANKDNPPRKSFQRVIDAFAEFLPQTKGKAGIYFHTLMQQQGGFNIPNYAGYKGVGKHIYHLSPYETMVKAEPKDIVTIMNAFDVLLMPSTNEGFGIPAIEAQACEVPVVVNNWTSMPELIIPDKTGILVEPDHLRWSNIQGYVAEPSTEQLTKAMTSLYKAKKSDKLKEMGANARKHILKKYDHDKLIRNNRIPLLEKISKDVTNNQRT